MAITVLSKEVADPFTVSSLACFEISLALSGALAVPVGLDEPGLNAGRCREFMAECKYGQVSSGSRPGDCPARVHIS